LRRDERSIGIFRLLIRNNIRRILWGILILVLLAGILLATFMPMANMPYFTLWMVRGRLEKEDFDNIDNFGITDGKGHFEILDRNLNVVFPEDSGKSYSSEFIDAVWDVDYLRARTQRNQYIKEGKKYIQIICSGTDSYDGWYLLVDSSYRYIDSVNFPFIKDKYTEEDLEYVQKELIYDVRTYKHEFVSGMGNAFTMLILYDEPAVILDDKEIDIVIGVGAGLVFIFLLFIVLSINSVSKRVRKPLKQLDAAMTDFTEGRYNDMHLDHRGVRELKNIMDTFNDMISKLEESEAENRQLTHEKQRLIADISHDLKTPVTIIQGYADALSQGKIPLSEQGEYLEKIQKKTGYLTSLINEFSYYSKIDIKAFELELKKIDVCSFIRDNMAENYEFITGSGLNVSVDIPGGPYICNLDTTHFRRCIENIISNFIKYNPAGTMVHAAVYDGGGTYTVVFENNGTPVDPDVASRIFEPFVMGDKSRTAGKGSGLGLAVVKKIVELHGGKIKYDSRPDYVNSFRISLPK
jgi:signal transduction histidine kinase